MAGLGLGEIVGSILYGQIQDKSSKLGSTLANLVGQVLAFAMLLIYVGVYKFSFGLALPLTFLWGVQDGGTNIVLNAMLGFQFDSKITPFSVMKFTQSLLIFVFIYIESFFDIANSKTLMVYFVIVACWSALSWSSYHFYFTLKPKNGDLLIQ